MAIKSLDERLNDLSSVEKDLNQVEVTSTAPGISVSYLEEQQEPVELVEEQPEFEPIKVAGVGKEILKEVLKSAPKRKEVPVMSPDKQIEKIEPYILIKEAEPEAAREILEEASKMPVSGKPSAPEGVPETVTNLDMITGPDELKQHIEAVGRAYGADKIERMSYIELANKISEQGYDEAFIASILDPARKTMANPADAYRMMLAVTDAGDRSFKLGEQVKAAAANGTLTPELATEFQQAVALEGVLLNAARGRQADIARTLGIFSQARQSTAERGAMLQAILSESGGIDSVADFASKYIALDTRSGRAALAQKSIGGTLKDIWFTTWINGLLSSPVTHAKNIAGNAFFGAYQIPERALASVIGKARNVMFGGEQAIQFNEVYAQAVGMMQGIREGGAIAAQAFIKNQPTDPFQKIESARMGRDPFSFEMGDSPSAKAFSGALQYWGNFVTIPGRTLMAEDEFFKAVGYRMELNALATRAGNQEYARLVNAGIDTDEAANQAAAYMTRILTNPPADIQEAANGVARTITFTRELEPALQGIQRTLQNPLMKMFVPFVRTPTNIALEAMARTPGLNFGSPRFWSDYNAGGIRRDMAISRVTLGSTLVFGTGTLALEGKLTGYGPFRQGDKEVMKAQGWQEFSFVFNKSEISKELIKQFEGLTSVSIGPDKVYISYAGLEPLSALLAVAGTTGEFAMTPTADADMERLAMGAALSMYLYLGDQPMLTGFSDMMKAFTSKSEDGATMLYNIMAQSAKQASDVLIGGSPAGAYSSLVAGVERYIDPTRSQVIAAVDPDQIGALSGAAKGFWEAVGYYKSRNPLLSDTLPPMRDPITGAVKKVGKGNMYEMFSPFRLSDGKFAPAHKILYEYGLPLPQPDKKIQGVELTDKQYVRLIELATEDGVLEDDIITLGTDPALAELAAQDVEMAQTLLRKAISDRYSIARDLLIQEDLDLAIKIEQVQEQRRESGKYKR
jgi:hypothetical protein